MTSPITHNIQADPKAIALEKAEPAKKSSATKQQTKAAYILVLIALMSSLKTSTQTAQVQAKEQNQSINTQQQLIKQLEAIKAINFTHGDAFVKCHYWKVVYYTGIVHSGGGNPKHWNKHVIYEKKSVNLSWLDNHVNPNGINSTWDKVQGYQQQQVAKTFWTAKKLSGTKLYNLNIDMEKKGELRTLVETKINLGQQKSSIDQASINLTVQNLQQLVSEVGNVSQQLAAFSNRIASI